MAQNFVQDGDVLQHTAAAAITAGQVVKIGNVLGVALVDIPAGGTGSVKTTGVFTVPKVSGSVIAQGGLLLWDVSANSGAGAFAVGSATPATGDVSGPVAYAAEAAAAGTTELRVKFTGVPGTVA